MQEAIWYAVPMLGIPIFYDQYSVKFNIILFSLYNKINKLNLGNQNVHNAVDKGIAEVLYASNLTLEKICEKILLMMSNPKYKRKIQIFSNAFRDQKESPLQRAVWWIEWAMRNPSVFNGYEQDLNFLQIESVDVISFLTVVCGFLLYVTIFLVKNLCRIIFCCKATHTKRVAKKKHKNNPKQLKIHALLR